MNSSQDKQSFVYVKGRLPAHLSNWAADVGIEFRAHNEQAIYCLKYIVNKLELYWYGQQRFLPISVQAPGQKRMSSSNLLIKALGKKANIVADLSAGLGVDALTIASTGRKVYCIERCPPIAMLLYDGVSRCEPILADSINVYFRDSKSWLDEGSNKLDAIYIDTMFSDKKKSAKSSRQMQILRKLAGDDQDSELLLNCALKQNVSRVIVKKSANAAPPFEKTIAQYRGKSIRFDVLRPNVKA